MAPAPSAEEDAATIATADELLRTKPDAYWRDHDIQEAALERLDRLEPAAARDRDLYAFALLVGL
jgi:hypothetical protein